MSINFAGIPALTYIGSPYGMPVQIGGASGRAVPISVNWTTYQASTANSALTVNLSLFGQNTALLTKVRSVYIDNNGSNVPIYVTATDTQHTISAAPNQAVWAPVITNGFQFQITGIGFLDGSIPETQIFFTDVFVPPSTDVSIAQSLSLWLASPVIQRENTPTPGYNAPALGDQKFSGSFTFDNSIGNIAPISNHPGQNLYITQYQLSFNDIEGQLTGHVNLSNSIDGLVDQFVVVNSATNALSGILRDIRGNLRFNGASHWTIQGQAVNGAATSGAINFTITYTLNPD